MNWRRKLGYIVPASNAVVEMEVQRMLPIGVSAHFTRTPHHPDRAVRLPMMVDAVPELAALLSLSKVDAISFACTTGSFSDPAAEQGILDAISEHAPASTAATALVAAIRALGIARLAVVSPYPDAYNERLAAFLASHGFDVVELASLYSESAETLPPEQVAQFVRRHSGPGAEGVVISCTKLRTLEILRGLEEELRRPVISSISACHWHAMRVAGLDDDIPEGGRLFRCGITESSTGARRAS